MKLLSFLPWWIRYPVTTAGFIVGSYMAFEAWVIKEANTVVEPVKIEVQGMRERQNDFYRVVEDRMNQTDSKVNILLERSVQ